MHHHIVRSRARQIKRHSPLRAEGKLRDRQRTRRGRVRVSRPGPQLGKGHAPTGEFIIEKILIIDRLGLYGDGRAPSFRFQVGLIRNRTGSRSSRRSLNDLGRFASLQRGRQNTRRPGLESPATDLAEASGRRGFEPGGEAAVRLRPAVLMIPVLRDHYERLHISGKSLHTRHHINS